MFLYSLNLNEDLKIVLTSYKLIFGISFFAVLIIGVFSYFSVDSYQKELISQIENSAHQISETVKSSTKYDMLMNHRESLHRIIDTIGRQSGIEKIRIFNKVGKIIYSSDKPEVNKMVDKKTEACYACHTADKPIEKISISERTRVFTAHNDVRNLGIINPIYNEPACWQSGCHIHRADKKVLGVLDVTMSLKNVDEQIHVYKVKLMVFAILAIIANSFILWFIVHRLVGRPVKEFLRATDAVAKGDFNFEVEIDEKHEFRNLADSFNSMTRKLAETQRQLYHNAKLASIGQLAAGVAHEINNPLTGVLTYSSFSLKRIENGRVDIEDLKETLEVVVRETKKCREIVKSLLDFSRQIPPRKVEVNVNEVIDRVVGIIDNQLSISRINIIRNYQNDLPEIKADKNQLEQVLINLLVNAAHAIGHEGGTIALETREINSKGEKQIELTITDNGCGIPKENLEDIFEPFFTTKGQSGTGLGLSVAWGIIDEHHGTIEVKSEAGVGTTFIIRLPVNNNFSSKC